MDKELNAHSAFSWKRLPLGQWSWVDAIHDKLEPLGENRWFAYLVLILAMALLLHGLHWLSGALPAGHVTLPLLYTAAISPLAVGCMDYLDNLARRSLERFRPLLADDEAEVEQMARTLTTMPAVPMYLCHFVGLILFFAILLLDPTFFGLVRGYPLSDYVLYFVGWFNTGMLVMNLYHTLHQLAWVRFIHARAQRVSVIDRTPVFAFSILAYWTTVIGILWLYSFLYVFPMMRSNLVVVAFVSGTALLLMAVFFIPLYGIHERLAEEKERHLRNVRQQVETMFTLLHNERQDADLAGIEQLGKHLSALMLEEEYLGKLPTWPWPSGTVTKLMSVALLPLILIVAERMLGQLLP